MPVAVTDGLRVTVLGSSGSYPGPGRACSGYLVEGGGTRLVLDLGNGSLANLQQHLDVAQLDAVVLSHAHPDHWVDLCGLRVVLRYGLERERMPLVLGEATREQAAQTCGELEPTFAPRLVDDGDEVTIGALRLRFSRTVHYVPTLAVRVDGPGGRSMAYSADTGVGWSFARLGTGIDLALCEATVLADQEASQAGGHLSARQAGRMAAEAGVARLVLTHLWPTVDPVAARAEGAEAFGAAVEVAREHDVLDV